MQQPDLDRQLHDLASSLDPPRPDFGRVVADSRPMRPVRFVQLAAAVSIAALVVTAGALLLPGSNQTEVVLDSGGVETTAPTPTLLASTENMSVDLDYPDATIAADAAAYAAEWVRYGFNEPLPDVDLSDTFVLFVNIGRSSTCVPQFQGLDVSGGRWVLDTTTRGDEGADELGDGLLMCTADERPLAWVIAVPRQHLPSTTVLLHADEWARDVALQPVPPHDEGATCEQVVEALVNELREAAAGALATGGTLEVEGRVPDQLGPGSDCTESELRGLLRDRVLTLVEEVYASDEFAEADELVQRDVGNQLSVLVLLLEDAPTPQPT
ncbi:hypothetical protein [Euzebya rosea]|uniref:hypothetical protein n=1 Tax=Euzebya rosea TaxID=2052804 RepID=UPI000D3E4388|nr:hypothetical protein [Euzebya rosea]